MSKFFLDIAPTGTMTEYRSEPEVMQAFYSTPLECAAYEDDECIAEKFHSETEDGQYILEEIINKEWKYFSLEWDDVWEHPDGIVYEDVVMGGALTNRPVAKNIMPINFSEILVRLLSMNLLFGQLLMLILFRIRHLLGSNRVGLRQTVRLIMHIGILS